MKLWILRPNEIFTASGSHTLEDNPWDPWYDKTFGLVIRAETEDIARQLACGECKYDNFDENDKPWSSNKYSTCVELTSEGDPGKIIVDYNAA